VCSSSTTFVAAVLLQLGAHAQAPNNDSLAGLPNSADDCCKG
jgi:hypothetical protein